MYKLLFLVIVFLLGLSLLTHLAILPPPSPKERLEEKINKQEDEIYLTKGAGKGIFQKRHLEFNSVRRQ